MARQKNDGRGRLGGRAKGTPNKTTATLKEWLACVIDQNREKFDKELSNLSAPDFVKAFLTLLGYAIPKQQAVNIHSQIETEYTALKELLESCPEEFIERITDKLNSLSQIVEDNKQDLPQ